MSLATLALRSAWLTAAALLALPVPAHAVLIDFDALPASTNLGGVPDNPLSVISTGLAAQGVVFGKPGVSAGVAVISIPANAFSSPNAISGLDAAGQLTLAVAANVYFSFVLPDLTPATTDFLTFKVGDGGGDLDSWTITAFDLADVAIDVQNLSGTAHQTYTLAVSGIHRIEIVNTTGTDFGYLVDNLEFNAPGGAAVPVPASIALLGVGLAGLGAARRRRAA